MLCTSADVDAILGVAGPGDYDNLIELVTLLLEGVIGRTFDDSAPVTVAVDGTGRRDLPLPHWPLASIGDVIDNEGTTLTVDDDFTVDLAPGVLTRLSGGYRGSRWHTRPISVTYTRAVPGDLRALCARIVARVHRSQTLAGIIATNYPELEGLSQLTVSRWSATVAAERLDPTAALALNEFDTDIVHAYIDRRP